MKITRYQLIELFLATQLAFSYEASATSLKILPGHTLQLPPIAAKALKPTTEDSATLSLAVRLTQRNEDNFQYYLQHAYQPGDPLYGQYLTQREYRDSYGATREQVTEVIRYFNGLECKTTLIHKNALLIDFECPRSTLEQNLNVKISDWATETHERIRTIDRNPTIPAHLPIEAIHGLTTVPRRPYFIKKEESTLHAIGSGPNGGLSPSDIRTAYNLDAIKLGGTGQTLALFELDGYKASDIAKYKSQFKLPYIRLQNILVDGVKGIAGPGSDEVTLDIELMMAVAPYALKILVYEGPNTNAGVIDTYQRIADDNLARQVSSSWGLSELLNTEAERNTENKIFQQMAAQGQSMFAASGDSGAFDDETTLSVDDPASQPYVTGVGGTTLSVNRNHTYLDETTWWNPSRKMGSGGGSSAIWPIPTWQIHAITEATKGSRSARNVPDVSLNSDPNTGYAIYSGGKWQIFGGTSCAAPLWAAFTALVNQKRYTNRLGPIGFANPILYQLGYSSNNSTFFHDINNGSTNGHFPAVSQYDLSTGWGTFNGLHLLNELTQLPLATK